MKTNALTLIITLVVGIILAGSLLMPVISNAQTNMGTPITKSNADQLSYDEFGQYYTTDVSMILSQPIDASSVGDCVITVNDEIVPLRSGFNYHGIVYSNNIIVQINTSNNTGSPFFIEQLEDGLITTYSVAKFTDTTLNYSASNKSIEVTFTDSSDNTEKTITVYADYCFAVSNTPEYEYVNYATAFPNMFITEKEIKNNNGGVITTWSANITVDGTSYSIQAISDLSGSHIYSTTEHDFELTVEMVFDGLHLVDGTTDIYTGGTPKFNVYVDGELNDTITPVRSYIIGEVSGHATSGAAYSLLGAIPILVIVTILMVAIGAIAYRRAD